ncbi:ejaculatory bulb-specific protein 3 [Halictus rubicundus]|uniref:ejaculatory bulb-specific protein 3 n=1 Tax=Halictus rubicundus TaxID=77578 RepID=UPI004036199F
MKLQLCFLVTLLVFASFVQAQDSISHLMMDKRYLQRQIGCVLDQAPCDVIGRVIKRLLPEALNNNCGRCTPRQMEHAETLMAFMQQNYPNEWQSIMQYYSTMKYRTSNYV